MKMQDLKLSQYYYYY